jgi:L-threonylcarbamoyladenylate synthase
MMQTKVLQPDQLQDAIDLLKSGETVALPTETVYGLAADANNDTAIEKIFLAKGRPSDHPLIVHIEGVEKVCDWAEYIPSEVYVLAKHFWPGPLTMILQKKKGVSDLITGGLDSIGIRVPNHPIIRAIIKKLGYALVAPSANAHKKISPTQLSHVLKDLDGKIAAIVDGGSCTIGIESTIIDLRNETPTILRPGSITCEMIEQVLQKKIHIPYSHREKVAGNMEVHYQPEKPLFLLSLDNINQLSKGEGDLAIMHYSGLDKKDCAIYYHMSSNKSEYAKKLYSVLNAIDKTGARKILVEIPPNHDEWADVHDRLIKASSKGNSD